MTTANQPATAPSPTTTPTIAPTKPEVTPAPKTPFSPSIEPETTPKG